MNKAVIFDLDGVITDTAALHFKAWKMISEKIGIPFNHSNNEQLKGLSRMDSLEALLLAGKQTGNFTPEEKIELAQQKNHYYKELIQTLTPDDVLPGIKDLLEELKKHSIPAALASASHNAPFILKTIELNRFIDVIADPAAVKKGKPAPDLFLLAARELGVPPEKCIGIEDAKNGVSAIKAAGMFAIGVGDRFQLKEADLIVAHTKELNFKLIRSVL